MRNRGPQSGAGVLRRTGARRWAGVALLAALVSLSIGVTSAQAAGTINLSVAADPAESITTQLAASGTGAGIETYLNLKVKPAGGQACAANPGADDGVSVGNSDRNEPNPTYATSDNWTFQAAGSYLLCGWISNFYATTVYAQASLPITVRPPHLSLAITVPATAQPGQTFQIGTTAQAETDRSAYEYSLPDTGSGCPANADAASSASGSRSADFNAWDVVGGPLTKTQNQSFTTPGVYLFCAYFEYPRSDSPPEATAIAKTTVMAPAPPPPACVVPQVGARVSLASMQQSLQAAHCIGGRYALCGKPDGPQGDVIGLNPSPGTQLASGASVDVLLSTGPPCVVPSFSRGATQSSVQKAIRAAHCSVGRTSSVHTRSVRKGRVVALTPNPHTRLGSGASVKILVSSGPARHR